MKESTVKDFPELAAARKKALEADLRYMLDVKAWLESLGPYRSRELVRVNHIIGELERAYGGPL